MPEENKNIEDLLKKIEQFTKEKETKMMPPLLLTKPMYVDVVEKEILNPTLSKHEYIKVPFNPVTEVFSGVALWYFLAKDGVLQKAQDITILEAQEMMRGCSSYYAKILYIMREYPYDSIAMIELQKPYVFIIIPDNPHELPLLFQYEINVLIDSIEHHFNATTTFKYCDKYGMLLILSSKKEIAYGEANRILSELSTLQWTTESVDIISGLKYSVTIYYIKKDGDVVVFIPASIIQDFLNYIVTMGYKEKK